MNYKSRLSRCFAVAALIALTSLATFAQTRVYFARGATRATARGYLRGIRDEANFVLRAKAGQHMRVEIKGRGATRGMVTFPSGQGDGQPGGVIFDGILPDTGDYRISVSESSMADPWRGSFTVTIDIVCGTRVSIRANSFAGSPVSKRACGLCSARITILFSRGCRRRCRLKMTAAY